jgi:hypothetical protein
MPVMGEDPQELLTVLDLPADLTPASGLTVEQMVEDATALALLAAPCLSASLSLAQLGQARAILRGAVVRWAEAGSGALQSEAIGTYSYTVDLRQQRRGMFWPSEIAQLQKVCGLQSSGAFSVDTVGTGGALHADVCSINFGALYCSCGAVLTQGAPLYESP